MGLAGHRSPAYISHKLLPGSSRWKRASEDFHSTPSRQEATTQLLGWTCSLWPWPVVLIAGLCTPQHNERLALGCGWTWLGCAWSECVLPNPTGDCHQGEAGCKQSICWPSAILGPRLQRPRTPGKLDREWLHSSCRPSERMQSAVHYSQPRHFVSGVLGTLLLPGSDTPPSGPSGWRGGPLKNCTIQVRLKLPMPTTHLSSEALLTHRLNFLPGRIQDISHSDDLLEHLVLWFF